MIAQRDRIGASDLDGLDSLCHELYGGREEELFVRDLWMYAGCGVMAFGCVSHVLVICASTFGKSVRAFSAPVFLGAMSAAGAAWLCTCLLATLVRCQTCGRVVFGSASTEFGCRLSVACRYFAMQLFSRMEVCVTADCLFGVNLPQMHAASFRSEYSAATVCLIGLLLTGLNVVPFLSHGYGQRDICGPQKEDLVEQWRCAHFLAYFGVPVALLLLCDVATLRAALRRRRKRALAEVRKWDALTTAAIAMHVVFVVTAGPSAVVELVFGAQGGYGADTILGCAVRLAEYAGSSATFVICACVRFLFGMTLDELAAADGDAPHELPPAVPDDAPVRRARHLARLAEREDDGESAAQR